MTNLHTRVLIPGIKPMTMPVTDIEIDTGCIKDIITAVPEDIGVLNEYGSNRFMKKNGTLATITGMENGWIADMTDLSFPMDTGAKKKDG